MPFTLDLPRPLAGQGWRVKIADRERLEPPHVTIIRRLDRWRYGLRDEDCGFLDREPPPGDVPKELVQYIELNLRRLIDEWDAMYPKNPVKSPRNE